MSVQDAIISKIKAALKPDYLEVVNESRSHNVEKDAESHFKVIVVSEAFTAQKAVERHRAIYQALKEELEGPVHALALHVYTPDEWRSQGQSPDSPDCQGGNGR